MATIYGVCPSGYRDRRGRAYLAYRDLIGCCHGIKFNTRLVGKCERIRHIAWVKVHDAYSLEGHTRITGPQVMV